MKKRKGLKVFCYVVIKLTKSEQKKHKYKNNFMIKVKNN